MALDPVSALGVASAAVQFIDFATNLLSKSVKIHKHVSTRGAGFVPEYADLEIITKDLLRHSENLEKSSKGRSTNHKPNSNDEEIHKLCLECGRVASELLAALEKLRFVGKLRKLKSFWHALKTVWVEEEIESLQQRLDGFRQQLIINILVSLRQNDDETFHQNVALMDSINKVDYKTQTIGQKFLDYIDESKRWHTDLVNAIYQGNLDFEEGDFQSDSKLAAPADVGSHQSILSKFLDSLQFKHMTDRNEQIAEAYQETFKWLYKPPKEGANSWDSFAGWLEDESQSNVYWITGKAGCGKSTLMKYIYENPATKEHLKIWASDLPVVTAPFFFWNSGIHMQKSQFGLLQSLLHHSLTQCPNLIPRVCPKRWEAYRLFGDDPHPWTWAEAEKALVALIKEGGKIAKFCFFIDGLDEFDGHAVDLLELISRLLLLPNVKICASSRPWPVFEDAFKQKPSLILQYLTSHDIKHFASTKLYACPGYAELEKKEPEFAQNLVEDIATKSSGVFLWVYFVVRSLVQGLTDGDRICDLHKRLDDLPEELEMLFNNILETIEPRNLQHASELFQIVRTARLPVSLLSFSFADEEDPQFAIDFEIRALSNDEIMARCTTMKRRINSRCKGLLEIATVTREKSGSSKPVLSYVSEDPLSSGLFNSEQQAEATIEILSCSTVQYLHRTVKDYLERPDVWQRIQSNTSESFDPNLSLCRSLTVQLKTLPTHSLTLENFWSLIIQCMCYAAQSKNRDSKELMLLLDELDYTAGKLATMPSARGHSLLYSHIGPGKLGKVVPQWKLGKAMPHWSATGVRWLSDYSFLCLAVEGGLHSYVQSKLDDGSPIEQGWACPSLLDCAISKYKVITRDPEWQFPDAGRVEMIEMLLDRGADPNRVDSITLTPWQNLLDAIRRDSEAFKAGKHCRRTSYSHLQNDEEIVLSLDGKKAKMAYWMLVTELFIRHGASSWVNLNDATGSALREHDAQQALALELMLKRRRKSWSQIKRLAIRR